MIGAVVVVEVGLGERRRLAVGDADFELPDEHAASAVPAARAPSPSAATRRLSVGRSPVVVGLRSSTALLRVSGVAFVYYLRGDRMVQAPTCSDGCVAWCVHCNKFLTPPTVTPEGNCPRCGEPVERGLIPGMTRSADEPDARGSLAPQAARQRARALPRLPRAATRRLAVPPLSRCASAGASLSSRPARCSRMSIA